jgi:hypothetical protein
MTEVLHSSETPTQRLARLEKDALDLISARPLNALPSQFQSLIAAHGDQEGVTIHSGGSAAPLGIVNAYSKDITSIQFAHPMGDLKNPRLFNSIIVDQRTSKIIDLVEVLRTIDPNVELYLTSNKPPALIIDGSAIYLFSPQKPSEVYPHFRPAPSDRPLVHYIEMLRQLSYLLQHKAGIISPNQIESYQHTELDLMLLNILPGLAPILSALNRGSEQLLINRKEYTRWCQRRSIRFADQGLKRLQSQGVDLTRGYDSDQLHSLYRQLLAADNYPFSHIPGPHFYQGATPASSQAKTRPSKPSTQTE